MCETHSTKGVGTGCEPTVPYVHYVRPTVCEPSNKMVQIQMWLTVCVCVCCDVIHTKRHTHQTTQIPNVDNRYIALLCKTSESLENGEEEIGRITQKHGIKFLKTVTL